MAGPMPSFASGKSSSTAAAIMCAALCRIAARWSDASGAISSPSIAMRRSVTPPPPRRSPCPELRLAGVGEPAALHVRDVLVTAQERSVAQVTAVLHLHGVTGVRRARHERLAQRVVQHPALRREGVVEEDDVSEQ